MSEKPTPETDAAIDADGKYLHGEIVGGAPDEIMYVPSDFARRLERERDEAREALRECYHLLARYREGVPLGHQPHMIAHEADEALDRARTHRSRYA